MGVIVRKGNEHDPAGHAPAKSSPSPHPSPSTKSKPGANNLSSTHSMTISNSFLTPSPPKGGWKPPLKIFSTGSGKRDPTASASISENLQTKTPKQPLPSSTPCPDRPRILELLNNESLPDAAANNLLANQISSWSPSDRQGLESWIASITSPARREQALKELDQPKAIPFSITPRDPAELIAEHKSPNSAQPGPWSPRQTEEAITAYHQLTPEQKNEIFHQQRESPQDPFGGSQGKPSDSFQAEIYRDRLLNPPPNDKAPLNKIITFASTWAS